MQLVVNQSDLAVDSETASWLFENAAVDEAADPLFILLQAEIEIEETSWFPLHFN